MNRKSSIPLASMTVLVLALTHFSAKAAAARRTLKVKLNYSGAGIVDEKHKIYVLLFDGNPYTAKKLVDSTSDASPPFPTADVCHILRRQSASGKNEIATFKDLSISPVYAAAFLDRSGSYDGVSDPASGSPTGLYGKALDTAEPIELKEGKTVKVVLSFDDTTKIP
jgi:hypothetical protein